MTTYAVTSLQAPLVQFAGVIRNVSGSWELIDDSGHAPINIDSVTTTDTDITVNFGSASGVEVVSFQVTPDEVLTKAGFTAGASVATDKAIISLAQSIPSYSDYVAYTSGAFLSSNGVFTCDFTDGVLTLTHPQIIGTALNVSLTGRPGTALNYTPVISGGTTGSTFMKVEFRNSAGALISAPDTNMRVFATHGGGHKSTVDPGDITTTVYPNSNLWVSGLLKVS